MKVKTIHIEQLLESLSIKTGQPLDNKGFTEMEYIINDSNIKKKYLYEYMHRQTQLSRKQNSTTVNLTIAKLDILTRFVCGQTFRVYSAQLDRQRSSALLSCIGDYYCYVRRNASVGALLRSPVRIQERQGKIVFELQGGQWNYEGEAELKNGCLFILMKATGGKEIHHIYKLGISEKPKIMQGIFSAVSSTFEPIGGRCVLVRSNAPFEKLTAVELKVSELKKGKQLEERRLAEYFGSYEENNLSIKKVDTFRLEDLGSCK